MKRFFLIAALVAPAFAPTAEAQLTGGSMIPSPSSSNADGAGNARTVSALAYGADPTGVADSTAAIQRAIDTGTNSGNASAGLPSTCVYLPAGNYKVTGAITLPARNGCLYGDGRALTTLVASSSSFNLSAAGVVVLPAIPSAPGNTSSEVHDLGILFTQPDTSVRASLVAFPPAIYAQDSSRAKLSNLRIGGGSYCIDGRGNIGGAFIDDVECGALVKGLQLGSNATSAGSFDGVHIHAWHFWDFGIWDKSGLTSIYCDGSNVSMEIGRVDWLGVTDSQNFCGKVHYLAEAANATDQHQWTNVALDDGQWLQEGGVVQITNIQSATSGAGPGGSSSGWPAAISVAQSGGVNDYLYVRNATLSGYQGSAGLVSVSGGSLDLEGGSLACGAGAYSCGQVNSGILALRDMQFSPNAAFGAVPFVVQNGGSLQFTGNLFLSANAPVGVKFTSDSAWNRFDPAANTMNGASALLPSSTSAGNYGNAASVAGNVSAGANVSAGGALTANSVENGIGAVYVDSGSNQAAVVQFKNAGSAKWNVGNTNGALNTFVVTDDANGSSNWLQVSTGGNATIGESSSNTLTINGNIAAGGAVTVNGGSLTVASSSGASDLVLQAQSGYGTGIVFQANGANRWIGQAGSSGAFDLYDVTNSANWLAVSPGGIATVGEQSSNVLTIAGSLAAKTGATPSASGSCAVTSQVGGQIAGGFKASGACPGGTGTLTFAAAQANGYACDAHDETTPADLLNQTGHTTSSVTFAGTMAAGDVVVWKCVGF